MQILASALPGFRDLRAPLTAGYLWLLFVYLLARPDLGTRPASTIGGALYDLANEVGRVWVAVGVGIAAYLIGAISVGLGDRLYRPTVMLRRISRGSLWAYQGMFWVVIGNLREYFHLVLGRIRVRESLPDLDISERTEQFLRRTNGSVADQYSRFVGNHPQPDRIDQERLAGALARAIRETEREPDLPATVLVDDKPVLFAEVDRLRAEGDLRLAVAVPLCALAVLLTIVSSPWWIASLVGVTVLVVQGDTRRLQSRQVIIDAIQQGRIESPALARLTDWVDVELDRAKSPE